MRSMPGLLLASACLLVLAGPAAADPGDPVFDEPYTFQEFHDPGVLVLEDAAGNRSELDFGYRGLPYEVVKAWPKGKTIRVRYAPADGTHVVDPESGERYPIADAWPRVDVLLERCRARATSTLEHQACAHEATAAWDTERERAYRRWMESGASRETRSALRSAQHAWTGYRDAQLALLAARSSEGGGSIHRMQAADAALALSRDQAGRLLALQAPPAPDASAEDAPLFLEIDDFPRLDDFEDAAAFQARIDQYEEECRDAWISSSMGSKCGVAAGLWDRELNAAYRALLGVLDDEAKNELREGQRGWVRMRDATLAFDGRVQALHYDDGQRMWIPVMSVQRDGTLAELTKTRTLQLRTWKRRIDSPVSSLL